MKNRRLYILLGISFLMLVILSLLFSNAYRQVVRYKKDVTKSHFIINEYEQLASNLKSTQIITNDFRGGDDAPIKTGLHLRMLDIRKNIEQLRTLEQDPVNKERVLRISAQVNRQFEAFAAYSADPTQNRDTSTAMINLAYQVHLSIDSSINRANDLLNASSLELDNNIGRLNLWMIFFGFLGFFILVYAGRTILKQIRITRAAEGYLQSVLNTTSNGILACSLVKDKRKVVDYRIDYVNQGFEEITGMKKEEVVGRRLSAVYQSAMRVPVQDVLGRIKNEAHQFTQKLQFGNAHKWLQVAVFRTDSQVTITLNDVTELKTTERHLKQKIEELEYTNEQLEQFAYVASHDLQEPLRKIQTFSELANSHAQGSDQDVSNYIEKIAVSSRRVSKLVSDLLDFSLLKKEVHFQPTDLGKIIRDVCTDYELLIDEKGAKVEVEGEMPIVDAEPLQMNQLFYNLLGNALKFSKPGVPPVVTIRSVLEREDGAKHPSTDPLFYYHITITDNGLGFDDQYARQIFDIFKRLHDKQSFDGSGIGLAICKKIVLNHKGQIYAESREGVGTTFHVRLPANFT